MYKCCILLFSNLCGQYCVVVQELSSGVLEDHMIKKSSVSSDINIDDDFLM